MRILVIFLSFIMLAGNAFATTHVKWQQNKVFDVPIAVNQETKVTFPEVTLMWDEANHKKLFQRSFIDRTLFITPLMPFERRVTFKGKDSNRIYIINFISVKEASSVNHLREVDIHLSDDNQKDSIEADEEDGLPELLKPVSYVDLVQFASQNVYSEIIEPAPGIREVSIQKRPVIGLYQSGVLKAVPLKSWVGGNVYVTAVKMTNTTSSDVAFEPCRVKGDFISVTPQHGVVSGKYNENFNSTAVYFLSNKPFAQAVNNRITKCRIK